MLNWAILIVEEQLKCKIKRNCTKTTSKVTNSIHMREDHNLLLFNQHISLRTKVIMVAMSYRKSNLLQREHILLNNCTMLLRLKIQLYSNLQISMWKRVRISINSHNLRIPATPLLLITQIMSITVNLMEASWNSII